jgi:hypothetical protein
MRPPREENKAQTMTYFERNNVLRAPGSAGFTGMSLSRGSKGSASSRSGSEALSCNSDDISSQNRRIGPVITIDDRVNVLDVQAQANDGQSVGGNSRTELRALRLLHVDPQSKLRQRTGHAHGTTIPPLGPNFRDNL